MVVEFLRNANPAKTTNFQEKFNLKLTDDYVWFLNETNGIISKDGKTFYVKGLDANIELDSLYGFIDDRDWLDIEFWMNQYASELPQNSVIIGSDILDNFLILICSGESAGLYYWDCSFSFKTSTKDSNAYYIAGSFTEFKKMMDNFVEDNK